MMKARIAETFITGCLILSAVLAAGCTSSSRQMMDQAEASWRKGHYEEAIRENENVYRREPRGRYAARALLNIGNIHYLNLRRLKQGIESYEKLTREFPDAAEALQAHRQLAEIYSAEVFDLDQAISEFTLLLEAEDLEDRAEILFRRADAFFKKEDYDRALRELRALEESGLEERLGAQVQLKIGSIYQIQKKFDQAIEPFSKAANSTWPESRRSAILSLAGTYEDLFDFGKAIETLRRLDHTPENVQFMNAEIVRLQQKRMQIERGGTPAWIQSREE